MTAGYIVETPSFDLAVSVYAAALRVIGKWTLLAGRVEVTTNQRDSRANSSQSSIHYVKTYTFIELRNGGTMFDFRKMDDQMWDALEEELASLRNGKSPDAANKVGRRYY
ncbi:hypothetical protein BT96DRAFT_945713 [Gymnopus androsaceus JB14]|uniref:Uncharacterized protein n=1 Tax=Gymnopus androsaceus JB14 TaxID=1447944 RepID=A0A6A4GZW2_9AGAR|nr:hypothetical protein BT96DRAFT_945713 [Gymnopus androsaceus JB14]